jgi:DNA invertase Pin-like site-specific DNA recombinase
LGVKYTAEQCLNISKALKGKASGEKNPAARLSWEIVREIRALHAEGKHTFVQLAEFYGCSNTAVEFVIQNKSWIDENYHYIVDKSANAPLTKLSWEIVRDIRRRYSNGNISQALLAGEYGVDKSTVKRIVQNRIWIDLDYIYDPLVGIRRRGFATCLNSGGKNPQ